MTIITLHSKFYSLLTEISPHIHTSILCDRIWRNPAYGIRALFAQCAFLVAQVKKCQSWVFVIFMPKNLPTNLCHRLRRLTVSYKGEISLHFDLPSLYYCRTRSPLLWALIRIIYLDSSNYCTFAHLFSFLGIWDPKIIVNNEFQPLLDLSVHFERLCPGPFNWFPGHA